MAGVSDFEAFLSGGLTGYFSTKADVNQRKQRLEQQQLWLDDLLESMGIKPLKGAEGSPGAEPVQAGGVPIGEAPESQERSSAPDPLGSNMMMRAWASGVEGDMRTRSGAMQNWVQ
jgi:hypothetical protein